MKRLPGRDRRRARVQRLLLGLAAHVRLLRAGDGELVCIGSELFGGEESVRLRVVESDPFELDEDEEVLDLGATVARDRQQVVRLGVGDLDVDPRPRVDLNAGDLLLDLVELVEELPQLAGGEVGNPAAIALGEGAAARHDPGPRRPRRVRVGAELGQFPADALGEDLGGRHVRARLVERVFRARP